MQLKDFMNYRVEMIRPTDTLQEAAEKMRYLDVGSMPVCEGQHLIGVITDRDSTYNYGRVRAFERRPSQSQGAI
jgi:CBS domain-containing protein